MPFYEYECPACKYYAEVLQKISDPPLRKCPSCGKGGFKRLVSAPVFRLKGSGWYETDFKSDQDRKRNLAGADRDEGNAASEDKGAAKPDEAKPADAKVSGEAGKPAASSKAEAKAPAAKAERTGKSAGASARRSSSSTRSAKPAPKRIIKRAPKPVARGGRKR